MKYVCPFDWMHNFKAWIELDIWNSGTDVLYSRVNFRTLNLKQLIETTEIA